ncbi:FAD-dependent monooxygenase [Nocardia aurantia]|uniref:3-(3-hydroxy-phenyl)propionate/3-hydroxycinnamic acid hydroxylase n=1 Tax=Nocardia aurantia TaxID=2585199 RepID=A0A7K0DQ92_9NOCA|nr:FAD-dependent monooxygenase [Nocardia aurantia]MQY27758.1 3-(3-hydroxy-phenyl)propionate/3-hydroxycinnamic acid hydroxylase [Nocardia aurantia]
MNSPARSALVVGAGIGGLTAAAALRRAGLEVVLCERGSTLRAAGFGLSLQSNAMNALRTLGTGIDEDLLRAGERARSASYRRPDGSVMRRVDVAPMEALLGAPAVVLARPDLHEVLLSHCGPDLRVESGAEVRGFTETADAVAVELADGRTLAADVLIGADGINSTIRARLHGAQPPRSGEFVCWLALARFDHPVVEPGESVQYWGTGQRFGISDLGDGRIYWWGTLTTTAELAAAWPHDKADLLARFTGWAPEIAEIISGTPEADILALPAQDRPPLPEWGRGRVTLLGDAAHPMLPSLGQGANAAIEDAIVLAHALATHDDAETALRGYEHRRIARMTMFVDESRKLGHLEQTVDPEVVAARDRYMSEPGEEGGRTRMLEPMTWPGLGDPEGGGTLPRPLSPLERWHWTVDRVAPLHIVSRLRVDGDLTAEAVRTGLAALVRRHPMLHAVVHSDEGRDPCFVPIAAQPIPLREATSGDWTAEIDTELRERFAAGAPPLRATLVTVAPGIHDLILTSVYTIADAVTILSFARQVLEFAAAGTTGWVPEIPALPGPEALLPSEFRGAEGKRRALERLRADAQRDGSRHPVRLAADAEVAPAQRFTRSVRRVVTGADYEALLAACQEHGVTPRSLVAAALARAAAADTGAPQAHHTIGVSVLFREHLERPLDDLRTGAYQAMLGLPIPAGPSLWAVAAEFERDFAARVADRAHLAGLAGIEFLVPETPDRAGEVIERLDAHGPGNLCLTYLDTREFPDRVGEWRISGAEFASGMSISGMTMLAVGIGSDALSLNLGYIEGLLTAERAGNLSAAVTTALRNGLPATETAAP